MQAIVWVMSTMFSCGTMYSRSGTGCLLIRYGVTRWIFFQWTASMSTIRSLMTGMLPIGSTSITRSLAALGAVPTASVRHVPCRAAASSRWVLQARPGLPFMRTPQEPQIACWQEQRIPTEPSTSSRTLRIASSTDWLSSMLDPVLVPVGGLARLRVEAADLQQVLRHRQYVLSWGCHLVIVTGE